MGFVRGICSGIRVTTLAGPDFVYNNNSCDVNEPLHREGAVR